MNETMKTKLKTMINLKYIMSLAAELIRSEIKSDYEVFALPDGQSVWNDWRRRHGVINDSESSGVDHSKYVKLDGGVADRSNLGLNVKSPVMGEYSEVALIPSGFILVPNELAQKTLVLGELPE